MSDKKYYIIGHTAVEYLFNGILLPKNNYNELERKRGKCKYTTVTEEELNRLKKNAQFNNLIDCNIIEICDKVPSYAMTGDEKAAKYRSQLSNVNTKLKEKDDEIRKLKEKLAELEKAKE